MQKYFRDQETLKKCRIYQMLLENATEPHLSFHTPGHKVGGWDITELSFSDNLSAPRGCILEAEKEIAEILGAAKSFILTDGSTCGVLSMLYAAKSLGVKSVALPKNGHKSVFNGCKLLGLTPLLYENEAPASACTEIFDVADGILLVSPDYYGNVPDLRWVRAYCDERGKLLLVDGAHGGHLHEDKTRYAGTYADFWVDGVHKSLPAFTQGAVVSARTERCAAALREGVDIFRTTSPSYPIMASVEYAVKYPRNVELEEAAWEFQKHPRIQSNDDWTKVCALFGNRAFDVEKELEEEGIYAEFCDGNVLMFYLSPATKLRDFERLKTRLTELFERYSYSPEKQTQRIPAPLVLHKNGQTEWVKLQDCAGRICAADCGLFPPCVPLIWAGERVEKDKIELLRKADNVFGIHEDKILVYKEETGYEKR